MPDLPISTFQEIMHTGMQYARSFQWSAAVDHYRRAIAVDPESLEARFRLGWALCNQAEADKPSLADMAMVYGAQVLGFEQAARDGRRRFQNNRLLLKDAVFYLNSVLEKDPNHARALHYLAKALFALDQKADAEQAARKAAQLEPANAAYTNLAQNFDSTTPSSTVSSESMANTPHTWDELVLELRTKRELRQMQIMLEKPDMARELGVHPPTGILLKGPPGTGKTTIARVLAYEAQCNFVSISPADINQMYVGESEKKVRDIFAKARASSPCIIFIDEIDALLPVRQGGVAIHSDKVVNQFLQEMDGITPNTRVFVVGATNRPDMLDPAVRRGGRLSREIEIPLPDYNARLQLFQLCTRSTNLCSDVSLEELASGSAGYSGADIKALVNEAGLIALIRLTDTEPESPKQLKQEDFLAAFKNLG